MTKRTIETTIYSFVIIALLFFPLLCVAQNKYEGYVGGDAIALPDPTPPVPNATIYSLMWDSPYSNLNVSDNRVRILSYFQGMETVTCSYWYTYRRGKNDEPHVQGYAEYRISCIPVSITNIPNEVTMERGNHSRGDRY